MRRKKLLIFILLILIIFAVVLPASAASKWAALAKTGWNLTKAPYNNARSPVNISWNSYLAKYYPTAAYCVIPSKVKKLNVYVQVFGKNTADSSYRLLNTSQIAKWNVTIDSSQRLPFHSGHTYQFKIRLAERKNGAFKPLTGFSDVKSVKILHYPKATAVQTGAGKVTLRWNQIAGAAGYTVWIDSAGGKSAKDSKIVLSGAGRTSYTFSGLKKGVLYSFMVSAFSGNTKSSDYSVSIRVS